MWKYGLVAAVLVTGCKNNKDSDEPNIDDLDNLVTMEVPSKRSEVLAAAHEATNQIMIFGGNEGPVVNQIPSAVFLRETWIFEPGTGWTEIESAEKPKKRGRYAIAMDHGGNRALLFGGRFRREGQTGNYEIFNDLWEFDFLTHEWNEITPGDPAGPRARYYPGMGYDETDGALYIWGGNLNSNPLQFERGDDLWKYQNGTWTQIPTSGTAPSPRVFFGSMWDAQRKRIVIFGGQIGDFQSQAYNGTYALDVTTGEWTELDPGTGSLDNNGSSPSTRLHAHMLHDETNDRYLLFGGHTDVGDHNDLWEMDPVSGRWSQLRIADTLNNTGLGCGGNPTEVPSDYVTVDVSAPERRHRGMYALMHDNLWISQGIHAECSNQVDDTWRFDLTTGNWTELIPATSGESCERRGDACQCLCL